MIKGYEKFRIEDASGKNDFFIEVNYNKDEDVQDCKTLKVTFPNREQAYIKRDTFLAMIFAIGRPEDQIKLIPQKIIKKRRFESLVRMKALKDIKKGEEIITTCYHDLPDLVDEVIGTLPVNKSPLLLPK